MKPTEASLDFEEQRRRSALTRITASLASLISVILGSTGFGYFISPAFQKKEEDWIDIGSADAFKPNQPSSVEYVERKRDAWVVTEKKSSAWVVMKQGGRLTVFDPRCSHLGCPYRWDVKDSRFLCPCHTGVFDIDGNVLGGPAPRPLDRYPAKVVEHRLLIIPEASREKKI